MSSDAPVPASGRTAWVDIARGLGIILVVFAHVLRGNYPLGGPGTWHAMTDHIIYSFHMPLFFVLSGMFLWHSIGKGRAGFVKDRWWQIVYPYLLWSGITAAIEMVLARWVNSQVTWRDVLLIPIVPIEQYWFLYALFITQMIAAIAYPRKWAVAAISVAGAFAMPLLSGPWILAGAFFYLPFVVAGILAGPVLQSLSQANLFVAAMVALCSWSVFAIVYQMESGYAIKLLLGLSGSLGAFGFAAMIAPFGGIARPLGLLGQASMAIYLSHTICSAGVRIGLRLVGIAPQDPVSLGLSVVLGLAAPFALWRFATTVGWTRVLGFGGKGRTALPTRKAIA